MGGLSPDDWAQVIYLLLLLMGLLGFFSFGGRGVGRRMRDLLIWVLILAMLIIVYGFRDRLSAGLFPVATTRISGDVIELRRGGDGHFVADLRVNDVPVRFMVDTGASQIVLSQRDAERVGIDPASLNYLGEARTANGTVAIAATRLGVVEFGGMVERDVRASVNAGTLDMSLLGMSFLDKFSRIEIIGDRMLLHL